MKIKTKNAQENYDNKIQIHMRHEFSASKICIVQNLLLVWE
jgi:hypothetical protein